MAEASELDDLEALAGHKFANKALLVQALTHPSCGVQPHYQRLEFVGDRVLGLLIAERLYQEYPGAREGDLALRYNELVRRETLAEIGERIGIDHFIRVSTGEEESGGRQKPAIIADCCEALIGALYLDGGLKAADAFIARCWVDLVEAVANKEKDPKTQLQEWAQGCGMAKPSYQVVTREGPAHAPEFTITVVLGKQHQATGKGGSKRIAEQDAARTLLDRLANET